MALWLALLLPLAAAAPATAQEKVPTRKACRAATAVPATIEAIQASPGPWQGRCVRLRGIVADGRLYAKRSDLADEVGMYGETPASSLALYPSPAGRRVPGPVEAQIVGTVGSCASAHAEVRAYGEAHPGVFAMVSGYCHTSVENFVRPRSVSPLSGARVARLTESEVPADRRPLVEAPEAAPDRPRHVAGARAMAAAITARDEAAFLRLSDPDSSFDLAGLDGARPEAWLRDKLRKAHRLFLRETGRGSVFAGLGPVERRQERTFVDRSELADAMRPDGEPPSHFVTCWCRTADCAGRWPVRLRDADNDVRRPYACVRTSDYLVPGKGSVIHAMVEPIPRPFAEP